MYVVLIANKSCPLDDKHWIKCDTLEDACKKAKCYDDLHYYVDICAVGMKLN